jgi:restriction system protein
MPTSLVILVSGAAIAVILLFALLDRRLCGHRLRQQRQLGDLAKLTWQQFEEVITDAYRRLGYRVAEVGGRGTADGGVDVILERDGQRVVVQAKHCRRDAVGASLVRELYGVRRAIGADGAIFVTMGRFSSAAIAFADQVDMTLVDRPELLRIIDTGLAGVPFEVLMAAATAVPTCPACGADMVQRTAHRGAHAGQLFWGCSTFPACRATRPLDAEPVRTH